MTASLNSEAGSHTPLVSTPPGFLRGELIHRKYDGISDDLLTAGLGHQGIASGQLPAFADPDAPTASELRRRAIYNAYHELIDCTAAGGFGVYFGPATEGAYASASDGKIDGDEFLSFAVSASGDSHRAVTLMVQIPASFDWSDPCIIAAASSGSRAIYGAVPTVGEWGLKHRCAVAYTDKGTGIGAHDLENDAVYSITGERTSAAAAGDASTFTASLSAEQQASFNRAWPHRYAFKHAHSEALPDRYWADDVLRSIEFALYALNSIRPAGSRELTAANTPIIASSISNGGAAALLAAEKDTGGLVHAVVAAEPAIQPAKSRSFVIVQGDREPLAGHSRSLIDYASLLNVYQPCALLDPDVIAQAAPFPVSGSPERCRALHDRGLLKSATAAEQGAEAQAIINGYGILEEQNALEPSHYFIPLALTVTYANSYGRFSVADNLAGYSFAAIDTGCGPTQLDAPVAAQLFSLANGIPPTPLNGVTVINNAAPRGGLLDWVSTPDRNLEGALRLRRLATGLPEGGEPLTEEEREQHKRICEGSEAVRASGNLRRIPAIIVHGRSDGVIPPNHSSRAYYGLNHLVEGDDSRLRYYEIKHAHHFDAFNALPGYAERWVPLHHYFIQALAIMLNHLKSKGALPLPPSQVVDPVPRGIDATGKAPPIGPANLPPIAFDPDPGRRIAFGQGRLHIPE